MPPELHCRRVILVLLLSASLAGPGHAEPSMFLARRAAEGALQVEALPPGSVLEQVFSGQRVIQSRVVNPSAPVRLIVEFDTEPLVTARLHDLRALPPRRMERLRADLTALAGTSGSSRTPSPRPEITREFSQVFSGAAITVARDLVGRVRALPYVRAVFADDSVHASDQESNALIGADRVQNELGLTGEGVRVGIVDTGIDYDHPAFGGGIGPGHRVAGGWNFVTDTPDPRDDNGHGTHVAGIVAGNGSGVLGVAPRATLYAFKVLNAGGGGLFSWVLAGLDRVLDPDGDPATDDAMQVINLSFGGQGSADDALSIALDHLCEAGVTCVAAAGNQGSYFQITSPGTSRRAITVGACDNQNSLAYFSSMGPTPGGDDLKPDLLAPGVFISSAALGGGTTIKSGTSMASPHVAGVAALLRELHPEWDVERVKAAIVGTAVDVGLSAFQQGAGRVDAFAAATPTFVVTPTHIAYGRIDSSVPIWSRRDTLHVTNLGASARTVQFQASTTLTPGATIVLSPASVALAPGGEADVVAELTVDNAITPFPSIFPVPYVVSEPLGYDGVLIATSGTQTRRVPVAFHKAASLQVISSSPAMDWVTVYDARRGGFSVFNPGEAGGPPALLPPGDYEISASFYPLGTSVIHEHEHISGDRVVDIEPDEATLTLNFQNVDEHGAPVACNEGAAAMIHGATGWGWAFIGTPFSQLRVSPVSDAYRFEWLRTSTNFRDTRYTFSGTLNGVASSQTVSNAPADLHEVDLEIPRPPVPSAGLAMWEIFPDRIDPGLFAIATFDPTIAPVTGPLTYRWRLMTAPYEGHWESGAQLHFFPWDGGAPTHFYVNALELPMFALDRGWPLEGYLGMFPAAPRASLFGGSQLRTFEGAPVWHGGFQNNESQLGFAWDGYYQPVHLFSDMYGATRLEPDPAFTLSQGGVPLLADTLRGVGGYSTYMDTYYSLPQGAGAYDFDTSRSYTVHGRPARLQVSARFDSRMPDPNPPNLRLFQIFADGEATDSVAFATALDAGVRFHVTDGIAQCPATLSLRNPANGLWSALETEVNGQEMIARLPGTLDGPVALRLEAVDLSGNSLTLTWDPAFIAAAAPQLRVVAMGADAGGQVARISWHAAGGAGFIVTVERRESATAWTRALVGRLDQQGDFSYADSTVQPGHTYGYRIALGASGTPSASSEQWISIPGALAFALGGARPNPARAGDLMVAFSLSSGSPARLALIDITGREISAINAGASGPGSHLVRLAQPGALRPGIYLITLTQNGRRLTSRACVLR